MKKILLTLCLLIIVKVGFGQTNTFPPSGNIGIGTTTPTYKLDLIGSSRITGGFLNSDNYFEKVLPDIAFANGVANLAVDLKLGNVPLWGYIEVEITSTYNYQNSVGKLTKIYAVGINPGGAIYTNESRVSDVVGTIGDNIAFGELSWDNANSTYKIPISHIVSTGNNYTIKVKMFTNASVAKGVFDVINTGPVYNLTALPKSFVSFNGNVGIGTTAPTSPLHLMGNMTIQGLSTSNYIPTLLFKRYNDAAPMFSIGYRNPTLPNSNVDFNSINGNPITFSMVNVEKMSILENGNIGIGTGTPYSRFHVHTPGTTSSLITTGNNNGGTIFGHDADNTGIISGYLATGIKFGVSYSTTFSELMRIAPNGNVGIGTTTPTSKLEVNGNTKINGDLNIFNTTSKLVGFDDPVNYYLGHYPVTGSAGLDLHWYGGIRLSDKTGNVMQITNGNIGIGTTDTKGYKLAVAGEMIAERVVVKLTGTWPDYVFKKNYGLCPLEQVEQFINQNSHLPEVPSAQEVTDKGIDVGAMNAKLLQKVEELTLYLIEQNKEIKALKNKVEILEKK